MSMLKVKRSDNGKSLLAWVVSDREVSVPSSKRVISVSNIHMPDSDKIVLEDENGNRYSRDPYYREVPKKEKVYYFEMI